MDDMVPECPACGNELSAPNSQNFCGTCGEPINREPDREFIRRNASGLLSHTVCRQLLDTINGERDHRSEYTVMQVQEQARQALFDLALIQQWGGVEDGNVFLAGLDPDAAREEDVQKELQAQLIALFRVICLVYETLTPHLLAPFLTDAMRMAGDAEPDDDVDVEFSVNGERINEPWKEWLEED